ncbi:glycoside hydrolase family 9 protein [Promicromonospora citrea]|uniref:glycoside hydrolase family 9 protein n=1 Tax=Promicromonospora citrea TaxID=43677 RepID=UPI00361F9A71
MPAQTALPQTAQEDEELVLNGTFDETHKPWWSNAGMTPDVSTGELCVDVPDVADPWNAIVGQNDLALRPGGRYTLTLTARADRAFELRPRVQPTDGGAAYLSTGTPVGTTPRTVSFTFTAPEGELPVNNTLQLHLGGQGAATVCLDDVSLVGPPYRYVPDTGPAVKVNQAGYLPRGPKHATVVTAATKPQPWRLEAADGAVLATGRTTPRGTDPTSGENVHTVDFSRYRGTARGARLTTGGVTSHPFDVAADVYQDLRTDAMRFFYTNRSGVAIDGDVAGQEYARPAGHVGVAPNQGDQAVPCQEPKPWMDDWTCDYTLDVTGGWYDAGDHGKYVVNGGIATHQLLSAYERTLHARVVDDGALGDSTLHVPERGNGVPDVLDEARWNLEFMLAMQVPAGEPLAGMAHHKVHDVAWTGLPLLPSADPQPRALHRPSTAATLNLAAVAATGARLWEDLDPAFADELLTAARTAYDAAQAHPDLFAPREDGESGGGPYADDEVSDELYWAAAELYLTTGEKRFRTDVLRSPLHRADVFTDGFYWGSVAALGRLDLATVPSRLPGRPLVRRSVVEAADHLVAQQRAEAFGQTYTPADGLYPWGSNSSMLNNQVVIATAFDLTGDPVYARSVVEGLDYLLGRNVLGTSYVTGYGTVYAQNQHSRWYAHSLDPALPAPPRGTVAGGPNSSLQDPVSGAWLEGCLPQWCYVDDIRAWAVNEITINWNSSLAWVASFVADLGDGAVTRGSDPETRPCHRHHLPGVHGPAHAEHPRAEHVVGVGVPQPLAGPLQGRRSELVGNH